jgi:WD40 repeat protein
VKKLPFLAIALSLCVSLTSCPNLFVTPDQVPQGWNVEFRGGTTNFDPSFLSRNSTRESSKYWKELNERISHYTGNSVKIGIPETRDGSSRVDSQVGINFYVGITKDGTVPQQDIDLQFKNPEGNYKNTDGSDSKERYSAGIRWNDYILFKEHGSGNYNVTANTTDGIISKNISIDTKSEKLPVAKNFSASAAPDFFVAAWDSIPGAKSYLVFVYDPSANKFVWDGVVNKPNFATSNRVAFENNRIYQILVIAFNFDSRVPRTESLPLPLPNTFDASIIASSVYIAFPNISDSVTRPLSFRSKPLNQSSISVKLKNTGAGPLKYKSSLVGDSGLEITSLLQERFVRPNEETTIDIEGDCTSSSSENEKTSLLKIESNDPDEPIRNIPVYFECVDPIVANLNWSAVGGHTARINAVAWNPQGTQLATSGYDGNIMIWNKDGQFVKKLRLVDFTVDQAVNQLAWSLDGTKIVAVGGNNTYLKAWNTQTDQIVFEKQIGTQFSANGVSFDLTGSKIFLLKDTDLLVFDIGTNSEIKKISSVSSFAMNTNLNNFAVSTYEPSSSLSAVKILNTDTFAVVGDLELPLGSLVRSLSWNPQNNKIAGSNYNGFFIWDSITQKLLQNVRLEIGPGFIPSITSISWSATGKKIAVGQWSSSSVDPGTGRISIFSSHTGIIDLSIVEGVKTNYSFLSWSKGNSSILSAVGDGNSILSWSIAKP